MLHGGAGLDDHTRAQAARWASLGYAVHACDLFGAGLAGDRARVVAELTMLRDDPALLTRRAEAGLAVLRSQAGPAAALAAVGYCFGGLAALTMARRGSPIAAAVSIHGTLATVSPARPGTMTARVLVCHGAADPHVPLGDVTAFAAEMDHAEADWQLVMFGRAAHGFTHRDAVPGATPGVAYDRLADERSFAAARAFLAAALTA